jgi:hypothetical protein
MTAIFRNLPIAACSIVALLAPAFGVAAPADSSETMVLRQEARWLSAILAGDRRTIASILSTDYKHVDSRGRLYDRARELESVTREPIAMKWTQQTFDFAGDVVVVHGVNTIARSGKMRRERYADVYVKQAGTWMALSAQETAIEK